jgi:hypothetical protein
MPKTCIASVTKFDNKLAFSSLTFGHQHLRVQKAQEQSGAQTTVAQLSNDQRVDEIAQLLNTRPRKRFDFKAPEDMIYKVLTEDRIISLKV